MVLKHKDSISLVVPVLQEEKNLPKFLAALRGQTLLPNEIIFVEAGSTDKSLSLLEKWKKESTFSGPVLQILRNPGGFPGANRNRGIEQCRYPWVAFLDVRTIPQPEWLENMSRLSLTGPEVAWLGRCRMDGATAFGKAVCAVSYGCATTHTSLPGSVFQRKVFSNIGFFREDLRSAEDLVFMEKLKVSGLRFGFCREEKLHYKGFPKNGRELRRKYWIYSRGEISSGHRFWIYLLICILAFASTCVLIVHPDWMPGAICSYLFLRGVVDPVRRSRNLLWWLPSFKAFMIAPWVALQIDGTKVFASLSQLAIKVKHKA